MRALGRVLAAAGLAACLGGCGLLYTNVVVPLDLNVEEVPTQPVTGQSDWKAISYVVQFDWDSAAIADAARKGGIEHIYYADLEIFSVLGIWRQRTARVYGTGP